MIMKNWIGAAMMAATLSLGGAFASAPALADAQTTHKAAPDNKAKATDRFALVHSVDSARLADAVSRVGEERGAPIRGLMQLNVSGEESKGGLSPAEAEAEGERWLGLRGLRVEGVMTMAPLDADERILRATFGGARQVRERLAALGHPAAELSMGMSNDYEIAVEEGATMVRLGTVLFGARHA